MKYEIDFYQFSKIYFLKYKFERNSFFKFLKIAKNFFAFFAVFIFQKINFLNYTFYTQIVHQKCHSTFILELEYGSAIHIRGSKGTFGFCFQRK